MEGKLELFIRAANPWKSFTAGSLVLKLLLPQPPPGGWVLRENHALYCLIRHPASHPQAPGFQMCLRGSCLGRLTNATPVHIGPARTARFTEKACGPFALCISGRTSIVPSMGPPAAMGWKHWGAFALRPGHARHSRDSKQLTHLLPGLAGPGNRQVP